MVKKQNIINSFIQKRNYKSYLEIGILQKDNFNDVTCTKKVSVDPDKNCNADFIMTSDEFFNINKETYDIIFIDGLHIAEQVYKDILNSLKVLNNGGIIVCHDILPITEKIQGREQVYPNWTGDCWKAWYKFKELYPDVNSYVIDTDWGVGVIDSPNIVDYKGNVSFEGMDWEFFLKHKEKMGIIEVEKYIKLI